MFKIVSILNSRLKNDSNLQSKLEPFQYDFSLSFPDNKTFLFLKDEKLVSIFHADICFNIACITCQFCSPRFTPNDFLENVFDQFVTSIKNLDIAVINVIGFKLYFYGNISKKEWSFKKNTKTTVLLKELKLEMGEYQCNLLLDEQYRLKQEEEKKVAWGESKKEDKPEIDWTNAFKKEEKEADWTSSFGKTEEKKEWNFKESKPEIRFGDWSSEAKNNWSWK